MVSLIVFICMLGVLIIVHELGHFIAAKRLGVRVEKFSLGFGPELFFRAKGPTRYSINAIPLGGYVKLAGDNPEEYKGGFDEYLARAPFQRAQIIFLGPLLNYLLGILFFWLIFVVGYPALTTKVGGLLDGLGAKEAGMLVGDKILAVDGKKVYFWEDLQEMIQKRREAGTIMLSVMRDNKEYAIGVKIKEKQLGDLLGQKRKVGLIGIAPSTDEFIVVKRGPARSFILSLNTTWGLTTMTYKALWRMVTGKLSIRDSATGPLGIFFVTSKATKLGAIAVLHLVAVLSISLAIFNLLPVPVLDGGHILLLAVEKARGKGISPKAERIITHIGLAAVISLAVVVTYNDLLRFLGDKFSKIFG